MDAVLLSRMQSGLSIGVHFIFPGLTLGLALFILLAESVYLKTDRSLYRDISAFTSRLLALIFAFGVATGLILPFSFGSNWAEFSKATGPIFGTTLAVEGITAFTLESVFIGILLFGRNRVGKSTYWLSALLVFVGSHLSALVIISANSWMQTPFHDAAVAALAHPIPDAVRDGFYIDANGQYVLTNYRLVFFNPSTVARFLHTVTAAWLTGAVFMLGIAAWYLLHERDTDKARIMFRMAAVLSFLTAIAQPMLGDAQVQQAGKWQGAKKPAMEGVFVTRTHAPLYVAGWVDSTRRETHGLAVPSGTSVLDGDSPTFEVAGLDRYPESEWPRVGITFQAFHLMVLIGGVLIGVCAAAVAFAWRDNLARQRWLLRACLAAIPLPILANEAGWLAAEFGRQPWTVWKLMRTTQAASRIPAGYVAFSLPVISLALLGLLILFVRWAPRLAKKGIR